jgi:hypothetical protein
MSRGRLDAPFASFAVPARPTASGLCQSPTHQSEGMERRQALGCLRGTLLRASDVGPQARNVAPCVPAQISSRRPRSRGTLASRRSIAAVFWPQTRLGENLRTVHMSGALRSRIGAFARPARSGGRTVLPGRLPGVVVASQPAGRRIPLRLWHASGDALGERDIMGICSYRTIVKIRPALSTVALGKGALAAHPWASQCGCRIQVPPNWRLGAETPYQFVATKSE